MSGKDNTLGNYHYPSSKQHPKESTGNQQIFDKGKQVGSLEYIPDSNKGFKIQVNNKKGDKVSDL